MSNTHTFLKRLALVVFLALTLALAAGLALAGRSDNAESGFEGPIVADQPESGDGITAADTRSQFDGSSLNAEGQPGSAAPGFVGAQIEPQAAPSAPQAQHYLRAAGSNFQPRDSSATFSYGGGGCMSRNSNTGDSWFTVDIQLPDGAVVDSMSAYYYDNHATYDINSELWAFDGAGGTTLIAEADSSGTPGYSSTSSAPFSYTVNNTDASLVVVASIQGGVGATLQLCGVRLGYQYSPFNTSYLPATMNLP